MCAYGMELLSVIRASFAQWWATPTISLGSDPNIFIMPINETTGVLSSTPFKNSKIFIGIMSTQRLERPYLSNQHEALDYLKFTPDMLERMRLALSHHPEDLALLRNEYTSASIPPPSRPLTPSNYLPRPGATSVEEVPIERQPALEQSLHQLHLYINRVRRDMEKEQRLRNLEL